LCCTPEIFLSPAFKGAALPGASVSQLHEKLAAGNSPAPRFLKSQPVELGAKPAQQEARCPEISALPGLRKAGLQKSSAQELRSL